MLREGLFKKAAKQGKAACGKGQRHRDGRCGNAGHHQSAGSGRAHSRACACGNGAAGGADFMAAGDFARDFVGEFADDDGLRKAHDGFLSIFSLQ